MLRTDGLRMRVSWPEVVVEVFGWEFDRGGGCRWTWRRVALQVAGYLKELAEKNASDVTAVASDQLLLAALELTAIEWRE